MTSALLKANTTVSWGERVIMLLGGVPAALALMALASVLPKIDAALAHSAQDSFLVKQLIGAVGLAMVVGAPAAGFLVNRIGLRNLLIAALIIYVAAGTAGLYISDLPTLLVTRLCVGLVAATVQIMGISLISVRYGESERAKWMGRHIGCAMIGTIFLHPVAGMLGDIDWRGPFVLYAAALLLLPAAFNCQHTLHNADTNTNTNTQANTNANSTQEISKNSSPTSAQKPSLISSFPWHYLLFGMLLGGIAYLPMVYAPYLLRQNGISSSTIMSLVLTADSLAGASMAMFFGRARKRLSHYEAFAISLACSGCGALIAVTAHNVVGIIIGLLIYGLGIGWFTPNLMTALSKKVSPLQQAKAAGFVKGAHFLSAPLFITLAEPIARHHGPRGAILIIAVLALCLLVLVLIRSRQARLPSENVGAGLDSKGVL